MKVAQIPSWGFLGVHCFDSKMFYCWWILSWKLFLHHWGIGDFDVIIQFVLIFVSHKLLRGLLERPLSEKTGLQWRAPSSPPRFHPPPASVQGVYSECSQLEPWGIWSENRVVVFAVPPSYFFTPAFSPLPLPKKEKISLACLLIFNHKRLAFLLHPSMHPSVQHTPRCWCFKFI